MPLHKLRDVSYRVIKMQPASDPCPIGPPLPVSSLSTKDSIRTVYHHSDRFIQLAALSLSLAQNERLRRHGNIFLVKRMIMGQTEHLLCLFCMAHAQPHSFMLSLIALTPFSYNLHNQQRSISSESSSSDIPRDLPPLVLSPQPCRVVIIGWMGSRKRYLQK